jgi:hypothetical protein
MPRQITRSDLFQMEAEIAAMKTQTPTLYFLLDKPIKLFYTKLAHELKSTHSRFDALRAKYIQQDLDGTFKTVTGPDGKAKWKFIDSLPDLQAARILDVSQVEKRYLQESESFLSQMITIDW